MVMKTCEKHSTNQAKLETFAKIIGLLVGLKALAASGMFLVWLGIQAHGIAGGIAVLAMLTVGAAAVGAWVVHRS